MSLKIAAAQCVHFGINPEEEFGEVVDSETIWPHQIVSDNGLAAHSVHSSSLYLWLLSPVSPKHVSVEKKVKAFHANMKINFT